MGNPYAPRTRAGTPIVFPAARLRRVGATPDEIGEARANWAGWTKTERGEAVDALAELTDGELWGDLMAARNGDPYPDALLGVPDGAGSPPPSPLAAAQGSGWAEGADGEVRGSQGATEANAALVAGTIRDVLVRVAGDPETAARAAHAEAAGRRRVGLLRELRRVAAGR